MKNNALKFGIIGGLITGGFTVIGTLTMNSDASFKNAELLGYTGILLAFSMIIIGMIKERQQRGGVITYGQTLAVGLKIALIASLIYVAAWMIITAMKPEVLEGMFTMMEENLKTQGLSAEDLQDQLDQMATWRGYYANPFAKAAMTFLEIFPIGLGISLIAAIFIQRKSTPNLESALDEAI
jgi:hypothetical protein